MNALIIAFPAILCEISRGIAAKDKKTKRKKEREGRDGKRKKRANAFGDIDDDEGMN